MIYLDANVILRYLLADETGQHSTSKSIIDGTQDLFILDGVILEVIYVLTKTYGIHRKQASQVLIELFEQKRFFFESKELILEALNIYKKRNLDFIDCMLCACKKLRDAEIFTFDKKLLKCLAISKETKE